MRLTLHIGATKTGSSAFQRHCARRRDALAEAGVLYPEQGLVSGAHHLVAACLHPTARGLHRAFFREIDRTGAEMLHQFAAEIIADAERAGAEDILLSSEYLWGAFPETFYEEWLAAFHGLEVRVLAVVRRQDDWAQSSYLQGVKNGLAESFPDWWARRSAQAHFGADFAAVLRPWAEALGPGNVRVLTYDDVVEGGDAVRALLAALDIDRLPLEAPTPDRVNPSPAAEVVDLLLAVNQSGMAEAAKTEIRSIILRDGPKRALGAPLEIIPDTEKLRLLNDAARANAYILATFLRDGRERLYARPWPVAG